MLKTWEGNCMGIRLSKHRLYDYVQTCFQYKMGTISLAPTFQCATLKSWEWA